MFLHIGGDVVLPLREILGVFDASLEKTSEITAQYIRGAQSEGRIRNLSPRKPKSIVVTGKVIYLSPISAPTLKKRTEEAYAGKIQ